MKTRMEKYYDTHEEHVGSRSKRNEDLYREINKSEIESFEINSNATVISNSGRNIDVDKIKKILDTKYKEAPKRRSIIVDDTLEEETISLEQTREYDINAILEKAREKKEVDYEKDRLKKIRDTQFDILKNLNLKEEKEDLEDTQENNLMTLIDAINEKENKQKDIDPLDLFTDLKGSENTIVLDGLKEEVENVVVEDKKEKEDNKIDDSFYTASVNFTQSDFDDFNDLKAEVNSHKVLIRVVIALIIIAFIAGLIIALNMLGVF